MTQDVKRIVATYYASWRDKDFDTLRSVLADDATFRGPLGQAEGGDACVKGIEGLSEIVTDVVVHKMLADGPDVLTWFELHTTVAPPVPTATWAHVEDGRITRVRATFDPRPLVR
jgi:ketosteroid isomerase-like protein